MDTRKCLLLLLPLCILIYSCNDDLNKVVRQYDAQGVVIATPYIWKTSLHKGRPMSNSRIRNQIIYNGNIVVPRTNGNNNRLLSLIDSRNGTILWNWDDLFEGQEHIDISFHHQYNNLLTWHTGASFCINLDDGSTKWKHRRDRSFDVRVSPFGQYYFTFAQIVNSHNGYREGIAFKGDMRTGILSEFLTANYSYDCYECVRSIGHITQVPGQEHLLLVYYGENLPDWINQPFYGLYDTVSGEWIWYNVLVKPPQDTNWSFHAPIIYNNRIYAAFRTSIVCHDLETGELLWRRDFNGSFTFSGIIVENGRVIANCEDTFMYALDAVTGHHLWRQRTAGTSSRMSYLNGVVYMVGGSCGGHLYAIEASSGKLLWRINAGLLGEGSGAMFRINAVYTLPAIGTQPAKVIALSNLYAYAFEAVR